MIELILPWPPSVNSYKKVGRLITTKNGKLYQTRVNTQDTKEFYYYVWLKIRALKADKASSAILPLTQNIEAHVYLYPPDNLRRDIDNPVKVLLDSLVKGGLLKDDYQVNKLVIERKEIRKVGEVLLIIF